MRVRSYLPIWAIILLFMPVQAESSKSSAGNGFSGGASSSYSGSDETGWSDNNKRAVSGGYIPPDAFETMVDGFEEMVESRMVRSSASPSSSTSSGSERGDNGYPPMRLSGNEAEFEVTTINDKNNQMVKSETELGKDKELFHFTLDFVRVWDVISRKSTWRSIARKCMKTIARVTGRDDYNVLFKELAVEMLGDIRRQDRGSPLKLFKGTIKQAEAYARGKGAFIIVYIEDPGNAVATEDSAVFRKALSDPDLGKVLNDEFVFFAGSTRHNPTFRLARQLGPFKKKDFPLLIALAPSYVDLPSKSAGVPEKLAVFGVPSRDVDAKKIMQFLARVKKVHGPTLQAKQKEFLELLRLQDEEQQPDGE